MQALPEVHGVPRKGRTPAEEQLWLQLHSMYAAEAQQLAQKVRLDACILQMHVSSRAARLAIHAVNAPPASQRQSRGDAAGRMTHTSWSSPDRASSMHAGRGLGLLWGLHHRWVACMRLTPPHA